MQVRRRAPIRRPGVLFWSLSGAVLVLDQLSKVLVRGLWGSLEPVHPLDRIASGFIGAKFEPYESLPLLGDWLRVSLVHNQGAAFGLLPGQRVLFVITSLLVLALLGVYWWRLRPRGLVVVIGLSLAAAGAVGNLVDRTVIGTVTDFIDVAAIDFPVFNVADSAITVGSAILIFWLLFSANDADEEVTNGGHGAETAASEAHDEAH